MKLLAFLLACCKKTQKMATCIQVRVSLQLTAVCAKRSSEDSHQNHCTTNIDRKLISRECYGTEYSYNLPPCESVDLDTTSESVIMTVLVEEGNVCTS